MEGARDGRKGKDPEMSCPSFKDHIILHAQFGKGHFDDGQRMAFQRLPDCTYTRIYIHS